MNETKYLNELTNVNKTDIKDNSFNNIKTWAICVKIYDGDTIHILFKPYEGIILNFNENSKEFSKLPFFNVSCRMMGYNSAEIHSSQPNEKEQAIKSKQYLCDLILDKIIWVEFDKNDKYGRPLINVMLEDKKTNINQMMIEGGYGKPYNGKGEKLF